VTFGSLCVCFTHNNKISINTSCLFQKYVLRLLGTVYETVGFNALAKDDHPTKLIRNTVLTWACNFNSEICLDNALQVFEPWINGGPNL
jgi:hypothetical protein